MSGEKDVWFNASFVINIKSFVCSMVKKTGSTFWSLRQMVNWVRGEKLLAVVHFIYFLRILQKLSFQHPSRQNWTTKVWFFSAKGRKLMKQSEQTTSHPLLFPDLSELKITVCSSNYFSMVCSKHSKWNGQPTRDQKDNRRQTIRQSNAPFWLTYGMGVENSPPL